LTADTRPIPSPTNDNGFAETASAEIPAIGAKVAPSYRLAVELVYDCPALFYAVGESTWLDLLIFREAAAVFAAVYDSASN